MLKIRLRRIGKRHQPSYRIVVTEHTAPIQGKYLEPVGFYNPRAASNTSTVKEDRVLHWLNNGAQPSERVTKLLIAHKVEHKLIELPDYSRKPKRVSKKAQPAATETANTEEIKPEELAEVAADEPVVEVAAQEENIISTEVADGGSNLEETPVTETEEVSQ